MTLSEKAELTRLRAELDQTDDELLRVLDRRVQLCERVGAVKRDTDVPMMQPRRVEAVRQRVSAYARERGIDSEPLRRIYDAIIEEMCRLEDKIIGAPAGDEGPGRLARSARRIDHVAIAVRDLESAIAMFRDRYGFEVLERRRVSGEISGMDSATLRAGGVTFVLCQGDSPKSNVCQYIDNYGPGVQHIAIEVADQEALLVDLRDRGSDLLTGIIHASGLDQSFTKREPNTGIQMEFVSRTGNEGFHDDNVRELFTAMERENVF